MDKNIQKLEEWVCDEDKIVTIPWLSATLGITVKETKELVNQYIICSRKTQPGSLHVLYLLSGLCDKTLMITLAKEDDVDDKKEQFSSDPLVEVYSIQKSKNLDFNGIALVDCFNTSNPREGQCQLGSIIGQNCVKRNFKPKKALPPLPAPVIKEKTSFFTKLPPKSTNTSAASNSKACSGKAVQGSKVFATLFLVHLLQIHFFQQQSPLNGFFTTGDQKNVKKEPITPLATTNDSDSESVSQKSITKSTVKEIQNKKPAKKRGSSAKRRKRIVVEEESDDDIFASEGDDDEEDRSRKRKNLITDSDEEEPVVKQEPPPEPLPKNKRRKLVNHTFEDEEGFTITKKEWVEEDASEEEQTIKVPETNTVPEVKKEVKDTNGEKRNQNTSPKIEKIVNGKGRGKKLLLCCKNCQLIVSHEMNPGVCICVEPAVQPELSIESEEIEEIDDDELIKDEVVPHNIIWEEICAEFDNERQEVAEFTKSKETKCEVTPSFALQLFKDYFIDLVREILIEIMAKATEYECLQYQKHRFNGIDHIAEMLWNKNPLHPEREKKWTNIFDMDWVIEFLKHNPRPYYPLSWIWSRDYAATKIQAYYRAYLVKRRPDVQEMRQFWIIIKEENEEEARLKQLQEENGQ
ncbi:hypothetical protein FQR65_LT05792 [Abscondita terminalis]|nr:hypothetical protein FQR65_LT05792 [Abscondita terminalis]